VLQKANADGLSELAQFIVRNLAFCDHVALMGLEVHGYARECQDAVWIDPVDYARPLRDAVMLLAAHGVNVAIFNLPMCVLPREVWGFAEKSISDWKVEYAGPCQACEAKPACCGLFGTSDGQHSRAIHALAGGDLELLHRGRGINGRA
jgi:hypothetical protein